MIGERKDFFETFFGGYRALGAHLNSKREPPLFSSVTENLSATERGVSGAKTMCSGSFDLTWLICSFHSIKGLGVSIIEFLQVLDKQNKQNNISTSYPQ